MDNESIKGVLWDKNVLQIIWIFTLTFFMAIVRVFYKEVKNWYQIVRSAFLSVGAWMITGLVCYHFEFPFLLILACTSIMSFIWEKFFDVVITEFPNIFRDVLKSYLEKWKK